MWVLVKFSESKYKIWADYGDMAWDSPEYEIVGYFPSFKSAQTEASELFAKYFITL
jgi:hypothetical protein